METEEKRTDHTHQAESPVVEENKPEEEAPVENKRKLLPFEEIQKWKNLLVFSLMGLVFVIVIYIIYAPSKSDKEKKQAEQGLNLSVPEVSGSELVEDKETAYLQAGRERNEQERQTAMGALSDYFLETRPKNARDEFALPPEPGYGTESPGAISQSALAYRDIQHTLGTFYEDRSEIDALQQQIDALQSQLYERDSDREQLNDVQQQLELMEKSYEMAARYLPQTPAAPVNPFETAVERPMEVSPVNAHVRAERKEHSFVVLPDENSVVSALYQEVPDSIFVAEQLQERNHRFLSATEIMEDIPGKNTLKVAVHETVTLKDGETVRLRLLEAARVANMHIPKNTLLTAVAKVQGNRLSLSVTSIEYRERIIAVNLSAYGMDGQPGIFIPNPEEMNAVKEVVAGMGQNAGTSFTFNSSAGQQLASDAGRGVMQGASQFLNKKMREVKVTLKTGHLLYLSDNK